MPQQNQEAEKRQPTIQLDHYESRFEKRKPNLFFVFHVGEVTEKLYFDGLCSDLLHSSITSEKKNKSQFVLLKFVNGTPEQIVQSALEQVKVRQQKSAADTDEDIFWVVFDKDHGFSGKYSLAIALAQQEGISVAYSNECFELWLLLHWQEQTSSIGRRDLSDSLHEKWEAKVGRRIKKRKRKHFPYDIIRMDRQIAIERAKNLYELAKVKNPQSPWEVNPVTTVFELVEQLIVFFTE